MKINQLIEVITQAVKPSERVAARNAKVAAARNSAPTTPAPTTPAPTTPTAPTTPAEPAPAAPTTPAPTTPTAPTTPAEPTRWEKTKSFGRGAANLAAGALDAAGSVVGAPFGGLVRGYQTARHGGSFFPQQNNGPGYMGGAGSNSNSGADSQAAYRQGYQQGVQAAKSGLHENKVGYHSKFLGIEI